MLRRSFGRNQMLESYKEKMLEEVSLISLKKDCERARPLAGSAAF